MRSRDSARELRGALVAPYFSLLARRRYSPTVIAFFWMLYCVNRPDWPVTTCWMGAGMTTSSMSSYVCRGFHSFGGMICRPKEVSATGGSPVPSAGQPTGRTGFVVPPGGRQQHHTCSPHTAKTLGTEVQARTGAEGAGQEGFCGSGTDGRPKLKSPGRGPAVAVGPGGTHRSHKYNLPDNCAHPELGAKAKPVRETGRGSPGTREGVTRGLGTVSVSPPSELKLAGS